MKFLKFTSFVGVDYEDDYGVCSSYRRELCCCSCYGGI